MRRERILKDMNGRTDFYESADRLDESISDASSDDSLLAAVGRSDQRAFRHLMTRHGHPMLALAHRMLGNAHDADEIIQETFLKIWVSSERWRPDGAAQFSTWLYRVVVNACFDRLRRDRLRPLDEAEEQADVAPSGFEAATTVQRRRIILEAMAELPSRQRIALSLYYFSELNGPVAAKMLELSVPALEALLFRGKKSLRKQLLRKGVTGLGDM